MPFLSEDESVTGLGDLAEPGGQRKVVLEIQGEVVVWPVSWSFPSRKSKGRRVVGQGWARASLGGTTVPRWGDQGSCPMWGCQSRKESSLLPEQVDSSTVVLLTPPSEGIARNSPGHCQLSENQETTEAWGNLKTCVGKICLSFLHPSVHPSNDILLARHQAGPWCCTGNTEFDLEVFVFYFEIQTREQYSVIRGRTGVLDAHSTHLIPIPRDAEPASWRKQHST